MAAKKVKMFLSMLVTVPVEVDLDRNADGEVQAFLLHMPPARAQTASFFVEDVTMTEDTLCSIRDQACIAALTSVADEMRQHVEDDHALRTLEEIPEVSKDSKKDMMQ